MVYLITGEGENISDKEMDRYGWGDRVKSGFQIVMVRVRVVFVQVFAEKGHFHGFQAP